MGRGISGPQCIHGQEVTGNKTAMLFFYITTLMVSHDGYLQSIVV